MKSEYKVWRDSSWYIKSFPKFNKTIVWNDNKKTYDFYEGIINSKKEPIVIHKPIKTTKKYHYYTYILGSLVGVLSSVIIWLLLTK